ncbi:MAG: hypothetical protein GC162_07590 [Planctomycetes bacterium]|nr:hypothetical protein [Planctomycetota bacterium]
MKRPSAAAFVATFLALTLAPVLSARASVITWSSGLYVNTPSPLKDHMGTGQFDHTGTFVYAANAGGSATTFDGISFVAGGINFGSSFTTAHVNSATNPVSSTATFVATTTAKTVTLGVGGVGTLVNGATYRVQLLIMDGRNGTATRAMKVDGQNMGTFSPGYSAGVSYGDGRLITGTFIADATLSQSFTMLGYTDATYTTANTTQLNALTLYQTAVAIVPAPAALPAGLSLLGLLTLRRRR